MTGKNWDLPDRPEINLPPTQERKYNLRPKNPKVAKKTHCFIANKSNFLSYLQSVFKHDPTVCIKEQYGLISVFSNNQEIANLQFEYKSSVGPTIYISSGNNNENNHTFKRLLKTLNSMKERGQLREVKQVA